MFRIETTRRCWQWRRLRLGNPHQWLQNLKSMASFIMPVFESKLRLNTGVLHGEAYAKYYGKAYQE